MPEEALLWAKKGPAGAAHCQPSPTPQLASLPGHTATTVALLDPTGAVSLVGATAEMVSVGAEAPRTLPTAASHRFQVLFPRQSIGQKSQTSALFFLPRLGQILPHTGLALRPLSLSTGLAQKSQQWLQERVVPRLALLPSFPLCLLPIVLFFIDKSFCVYKPMQHDAVFLAVLTRACLACFSRAHSQKPPCGLSIHDYTVKWSNKSNQYANHIRYLSFLHDEAPYNPISYLEIDCTEAREMAERVDTCC